MQIKELVQGMQVEVLGKTYTVARRPMRNTNIAGTADILGEEITLSEDLTDYDTVSILMHEIIDLICRRLELPVRHQALTTIEVALTNTLTKTPLLLDLLHMLSEKSVPDVLGKILEPEERVS